MSIQHPHWGVAIFAARETFSSLTATVCAALTACKGRLATVDVLINGNHSLAADFASHVKTLPTDECTLRVWSISTPDKAHTWNEYVHRIWDSGGTTFFIDGYARVKPDALDAIERCLNSRPNALAASGVPSCGRSAKRLRNTMLRTGGIHGNLYALKCASMNALRETGFRFPLGLYRTDPMLGGALTFRLDPSNNEWTRGSVVAAADATWDVDGISTISYRNIVATLKRMLRQAHGILESHAFRDHMSMKRLPPRLLPGTAQDMVNNWIESQPAQARSLFLRQPLCIYAAYQLRKARDWSTTKNAPVLLAQTCARESP